MKRKTNNEVTQVALDGIIMAQGIRQVVELLFSKYHEQFKFCTIEFREINAQPALLFYEKNRLVCCQIFEFDNPGSQVRQIILISDQDKLTRIFSFEQFLSSPIAGKHSKTNKF